MDAAAGSGIAEVTFRSPGRVGVGRAIRRNADGSATVAVRYRGRPAVSVTADMIEGIVRAAKKGSFDASGRDALWRAAGEVLLAAQSPSSDGVGDAAVDHPGSGTDDRSHSSAARRSETGPGFGTPGEGAHSGRRQDHGHSAGRRAA